MATVTCCAPLLFCKRALGFEGKELQGTVKKPEATKHHREVKGFKVHNTSSVAGNLITMAELRTKVLAFRDLIDLSPCVGSASANELVITTVKDLHTMYPAIVPKNSMSEIQGTPIHQALVLFCDALRSVGDMWTSKGDWMEKPKCTTQNMAANEVEQHALAMLDEMIKIARERLFDLMDEDEPMKSYSPTGNAFGRALSESFSDNKSPTGSPATPTSVLPEIPINSRASYSSPLLLPLRIQAVGKLNPIDVKRLSFHMFPYMAASDKMNTTVEELKQKKEVKNDSEINDMEGIEDDADDCEMMEDIPKIFRANLDKVTSEKRRNWFGAPNITPVTGDMNVLLPPPSLSKLRSNIAALAEAEVLPPPPSPSILPKVETLSPPLMSHDVAGSTPPPPPPPHPPLMSSRLTPPPPSLPLPPCLSLPNTVSLPPPPPSQPNHAPNLTPGPPPPSPPPFTTSVQSAMPPPPPPPPMTSRNGATPPPPPLGMSSHGSGSPPPPLPRTSSSGSVPSPPPPPMPLGKGGAPPPPPALGGARSLRPKKAATKLKRSSQMGSLYRLLKGKVEGSSLDGKSSQGKRGKIGAPGGGKQGMADALAEMTKRSAYFQQIEEDVRNHAKAITEVKVAINNFQTTDMAELIKFHKYVESYLEKLTDESQVLARFEGFPGKKLEALRMAASLHSKLEAISNTLQKWKIEAPLGQLLDKSESYFNKIKGELDALERTKDEESKKFQSHKITFDFGILLKIKEWMVDVSSGCMELALKEKREEKARENEQGGPKVEGRKKGSVKMLWRAFQFAFRVYTFAGGQDDRADKLTRELAQEIESDPHH
ncbi:chromatin-remodeling ATPase INO80-like [Actinidia eriantha]|uniref:chromatin-remodeling ATPase INO80-like n=1 Tax=Actinidia eriantha TaxID=165200 RepID=UPI0025829037|nr:chromatin-remodeling ATPase INO80-like [Actinidia eriantha]